MSTDVRDPDLERYLRMVDNLDLTSLRNEYVFEANPDFRRRLEASTCDGMRDYWKEILYQCHLSSVVSILRTRHWFSAIADSIDHGNALAFAAALRGCMESAADSATSLKGAPLTLAQLHKRIEQALAGGLDDILCSPELETELIHFSNARHVPRKEKNDVPDTHIARTTQAYLKTLSDGRVPKVQEFYRIVCDLTHPAASSVWMWLATGPNSATLCAGQDRKVIRRVLESSPQFLIELAMFGFSPALLTLRMLNEFSLRDLHTPELDKWSLGDLDGWKKCADAFGQSHTSL